MTSKQKTQIIGNVVFLVFGAAYMILSTQIKQVNVFGVTVVSSATIPQILGVLLLILDAVSLVQNIMEIKKAKAASVIAQPEKDTESTEELDVAKALAEAEAMEEESEADNLSIVLTVVALGVFAVLIQPLGFLISSYIYMVAQIMILTLKEERKKKILFTLVISAVFVVTVYFLFTKGLGLILPKGILG